MVTTAGATAAANCPSPMVAPIAASTQITAAVVTPVTTLFARQNYPRPGGTPPR